MRGSPQEGIHPAPPPDLTGPPSRLRPRSIGVRVRGGTGAGTQNHKLPALWVPVHIAQGSESSSVVPIASSKM